MFYDSNIAPLPTQTKSYDVTNLTGVTQSSFTVPFYTTRLNPTTGPVLTGSADVNSWYNSLVVTLRRRMSHGLEMMFNYTLGRRPLTAARCQGSQHLGPLMEPGCSIDPYNRKLEYALSDLDQRQRFVGSVVYIPTYASHIANEAPQR